ncbi:hypothetical protein GGI20_002790 [Coemansia sp. BCRC 34301]|nr:hypothetical protein GGI20_002790 [Coemansia sp. BCRC 34301]
MCANVDCTWPFDCQDMSRCFEHDATVPSMRKRAKKRKSLAVKEVRRHKRVTIGPDSSIGSVLPSPGPTIDAPSGVLQSSLQQPSLGLLSGDLSDWLADLCQPSVTPSTAPNTSSCTPMSIAAASSSNADHSGLFMSQGNYQNDLQLQRNAQGMRDSCGEACSAAGVAITLCAPAPGSSSSYTSSVATRGGGQEDSGWLLSLLSPQSPQQLSNHGLTLLSSPVLPLSSGAAGGVATSTGVCSLYGDNVADLFAAFGNSASTATAISSSSASNPVRAPDTSFLSAFGGDAVIPRASRHPSPATSNNSESGPDDIGPRSPLSPDHLAMLIGGHGARDDVSKIFLPPTQPSAPVLDPLSMLLSPPSSAHVAGSTPAVSSAAASAPGVSSIDTIGLLDHYYWSNTQSTVPSSSIAAAAAALSASLPSSVVPANDIGSKHKLPGSTEPSSVGHGVPFDLDHLFSSPPLTTATSSSLSPQSSLAPISAEDVFGSSPTTNGGAKLTSSVQ